MAIDEGKAGSRLKREWGVATRRLVLPALVLICAVPAAYFLSLRTELAPGGEIARTQAEPSQSGSGLGSTHLPDDGRAVPAGGRGVDVASKQPFWRRALHWVGLPRTLAKAPRLESAVGEVGGRQGLHPFDRDGAGRRSDGPFDPALSIAGRVMDEDGTAVAGIGLTAWSLKLDSPEAWTTTDGAGLYRFEQLAAGEHRIRSAATARYLPAEIAARTGLGSADLVLTLDRSFSVVGTVADAQSGPLGGVSVSMVGEGSASVTTDSLGNYRLHIPVGGSGRVYTLRYRREGYQERVFSLGDELIHRQSEVRVDLDLERVKPLVAVTGRVSDNEGNPLGGETVFLLGPNRHQATTTETGEFLMPNVEAETAYRVWIHPRAPYRQYVKQVWVGAGGLTADVVVEGEQAAGYGRLSGRMVDSGGRPIPNFELWLEYSDSSGPRTLAVVGDGSGRFLVDDVPEGRVSFKSLSFPRFTLTGIQVNTGSESSVDLPLDWGAHEVHGRVLDSRGNPVPAPKVVLTSSIQSGGVRSQALRQTAADSSGSFRFTQVGPGVHLLSVNAPGYRSARLSHSVGGDGQDLVVRLEEDTSE